jgi:hypothetical protein
MIGSVSASLIDGNLKFARGQFPLAFLFIHSAQADMRFGWNP